MSGNKNSGRKAKHGKRTGIHVSAEVYQYLKAQPGGISTEVERLVRVELEKREAPNGNP